MIDELHYHAQCAAETLLIALRLLAADPTVHLPQQELAAYVKRYANLS